jgi:FkbM family methyltransferase
MRFHILGIPHTVTSKEYNACAYTQKVVKFGKMMTQRGHTVIHYGHEDSDLICSEHVSVITNKDLEIAYGNYDWRKNFFKFDVNDHAYQTFYKNAIAEVGKRKQKNDFILPFWGHGVRPICDAHQHDMIVVEPGIGYAGGHWARWKVFESYSIMHAFYGMQGVGHCQSDWYDVVIPNYFDEEDFIYSEEKEDYILFLSRVYEGKGIHIAVQAAQAAGVKLIVAGQNPDNLQFPDNVTYVGYADVETRKRLMAKAKGLIVASLYMEPFGGVQIESLLSGTPTITTDWGAFTENNIQGVTGYRCRTFADFVNAMKNVDKIKSSDCRKQGERFLLQNVAPMYEKYFQDVLNVYTGKGWYEIKKKKEPKKIFIDCGTHMFQGFEKHRLNLNIDNKWVIHGFEANPYVYEAAKDLRKNYISEGLNFNHHNLAVGTKTKSSTVNCAWAGYLGGFLHVGSNTLKNPPAVDTVFGENFDYVEKRIHEINFSDFVKNICDDEDYSILKMDIEGSEFEVLDHMILTGAIKLFKEVYIEFHQRFFDNPSFYEQKILKYKEFFKENNIILREDG